MGGGGRWRCVSKVKRRREEGRESSKIWKESTDRERRRKDIEEMEREKRVKEERYGIDRETARRGREGRRSDREVRGEG